MKNYSKPISGNEENNQIRTKNHEPNLRICSDHSRVLESTWHPLQWCTEGQWSFWSHAQGEYTKLACFGHCCHQVQRIVEETPGYCHEKRLLDRWGNRGLQTCETHKAAAFASSSCRPQELGLTCLILPVLVLVPVSKSTKKHREREREREREKDCVFGCLGSQQKWKF